MKIAVVGAGAVGTYYGARLAEAGHEVGFVIRSEFDLVSKDGITVLSKDGDIRLKDPLIAPNVEKLAAQFEPDWVLCGLKATALDISQELISPLMGAKTRMLAIINGLGIEEDFADWMTPDLVFGGLAFTCINRDNASLVNHLDYGPLTVAHFGDDPKRLEEAQSLWNGTKVDVSLADSRIAARYQKLCWNIPFNGLCVLEGGVTTDVIMRNPKLRAKAESLMNEVIAIANADLSTVSASPAIALDHTLVEQMMIMTAAMVDYRPSTMIDFVEGKEMEIDAIFSRPLERGHELGVRCDELESLTRQLIELDSRKS
tara:strand:+ start:579 stop:1523 length:945 start_codon:yes stop_codon:yes gene_type:complete